MNKEIKKAVKFRFQDLEIWRFAIENAEILFDIADELEMKRLFRFAEQLRGAGMSMPNNIAEGSASWSQREFYQFLNIARRSAFENANMLIIFYRRKLISEEAYTDAICRLDLLCRRISAFQKTLK